MAIITVEMVFCNGKKMEGDLRSDFIFDYVSKTFYHCTKSSSNRGENCFKLNLC